jgi:aminodeoxyfutalosine synthase
VEWPRPATHEAEGGGVDAGLKRELEDKVSAGQRLTREDGEALYASDELAWLGRLAQQTRVERGGDRVRFALTRHLHLTDLASAGCAYCSFRPGAADPDAHPVTVEDAVAVAAGMRDEQLTELHLVGAPHSALAWEYYPRILREVKAALPGVAVKAFTASGIHSLERTSALPASEILDELIDAGLDSFTAATAETVGCQVGERAGDHGTTGANASWEDWSRIHRLAHVKGLKTPSTMRYGHIEQPGHRVDHLLRLRELQDETGGFQVFVPLPYRHDVVDPAAGAGADPGQAPAPAESLKTFAVSRLLFDNVPHVSCFAEAHGLSVAQLALNFGVDDLDGSAVDSAMTDEPDGSGTPIAMHREYLLNAIRDAGYQPVERDARYEVVREYEPPVPLAQRRAEPQRVWA